MPGLRSVPCWGIAPSLVRQYEIGLRSLQDFKKIRIVEVKGYC